MLKTDYKADVFEGNRKYQISTDAQGVSEIVDVTTYVQEGDVFGPDAINATNAEINRIQGTADITLPAAGWSGAAPYTQKVQVPGVLATDEPELKLYTPKELSAAQVKINQKMTPLITDGVTGDGYVTFYCGIKRPTKDFQVRLKGVSANE